MDVKYSVLASEISRRGIKKNQNGDRGQYDRYVIESENFREIPFYMG